MANPNPNPNPNRLRLNIEQQFVAVQAAIDAGLNVDNYSQVVNEVQEEIAELPENAMPAIRREGIRSQAAPLIVPIVRVPQASQRAPSPEPEPPQFEAFLHSVKGKIEKMNFFIHRFQHDMETDILNGRLDKCIEAIEVNRVKFCFVFHTIEEMLSLAFVLRTCKAKVSVHWFRINCSLGGQGELQLFATKHTIAFSFVCMRSKAGAFSLCVVEK